MTLLFVVPDMGATISGGNLYNLGLTAALAGVGADLAVVDLAGGTALLQKGKPGRYFIDSLHLDALPRLRAVAQQGASLTLIVHYLPTMVAMGGIPTAAALSPEEREAIHAADRFLVPSAYMAGVLVTLGVAPERVQVVAPGLTVPPIIEAPPARAGLHALCVTNLVPGKGVLPFIEALVPHLRAPIPLSLAIAGSASMDPGYAAAVSARIASEPALRAAITLLGPLPHTDTLARLAESDLFVSPSRMESFGLALAEARALGIPIVARAGGNAAAHVDTAAGGLLVDGDEALAEVCALLARDPDERAARRRAAHSHRPPPRTWADAARDLLAQLPANAFD